LNIRLSPDAQRQRKTSARAQHSKSTCFGLKKCLAGFARRRTKRRHALARWAPRAANCALPRASFFFRGSSEYGGSASQNLLHLQPFFPIHVLLSFFLHERIRSLPFEKLSPKSFSNDDTSTLLPESIVDVGLNPSALSSSRLCSVPPEHGKRGCYCLAASSPASLSFREARRFYLSDSPSLLPLNHLATSEAPPDRGGSKRPSRISDDFYSDVHVARRTDLHPTALCPDLPVRHSFRMHACDFWEPKLEALPYPQAVDFRDSVPSPSEFTPKRFRAFHG
jgi:hypothetical protein